MFPIILIYNNNYAIDNSGSKKLASMKRNSLIK